MYTQLEQRHSPRPPVNLGTLQRMKAEGEKIAWLTAYDASFAMLVDMAGVDVVLVGDSLGMVIQGHETTVPVTMDDMVYHCRAVARGLGRPFMVADMPFMSYATREQALDNAVRLMQEGGAKMVKLEGGAWLAPTVAFLVERGIPVCAHLGLTPQSVHALGGFKVQGRDEKGRERLIAEAKRLEEAGAFSVVLELVPGSLAAEVTAALRVPTIGIGAGAGCDGQVLVLPDMLGLNRGFQPRFLRRFAELGDQAEAGVREFVRSVRDGEYPADEHTFS